MLMLEYIKLWWEMKVNNYLKKYVRRNRLSLTDVRAKFFIEAHEHFIEGALAKIKKFLDQVAHGKTKN